LISAPSLSAANIHFVEDIAATAKAVYDEEDVADVDVDAALQLWIELEV
jgi:hypothetical protein